MNLYSIRMQDLSQQEEKFHEFYRISPHNFHFLEKLLLAYRLTTETGKDTNTNRLVEITTQSQAIHLRIILGNYFLKLEGAIPHTLEICGFTIKKKAYWKYILLYLTFVNTNLWSWINTRRNKNYTFLPVSLICTVFFLCQIRPGLTF